MPLPIGLRNSHKREEVSPTLKQPSTASRHPSPESHNRGSYSDSKPKSANKKNQDPNLVSAYQDNFQGDNLEYINFLLKNKISSSQKSDKGQDESNKKKGHVRAKSHFVNAISNPPETKSSPPIKKTLDPIPSTRRE